MVKMIINYEKHVPESLAFFFFGTAFTVILQDKGRISPVGHSIKERLTTWTVFRISTIGSIFPEYV